MKAAMDKVQSSYLRSLQEVGDLLKKRAETIKNLKIWTPSYTPQIKTSTAMQPSVRPAATIQVRGKHTWASLLTDLVLCRSLTRHLWAQPGDSFFFLLFDTHLWLVATLIAHKLVSKLRNLYGNCHWKGKCVPLKKNSKLGERSGCCRGA